VVPSGHADRCGCVHCRNFAAQRETIYPHAFLALLGKLGINPNEEGEIYDAVGPFDWRSRPTGGWFYFVGEVVEKGERLVPDGDFQCWLQPSFPRAPECFGKYAAAIEFSAQVPWVLDESPV
jgi:hypothetical protein